MAPWNNQNINTLSGVKNLANNTATTIANVTVAAGSVAAGLVRYSVEVRDGTDVQVEEGLASFHVTNTNAGTIANNTVVKFGNQQAKTSGTLVVTWTITAANPALLQVNANSSLTPSTNYPQLTFAIDNMSNQQMTGA